MLALPTLHSHLVTILLGICYLFFPISTSIAQAPEKPLNPMGMAVWDSLSLVKVFVFNTQSQQLADKTEAIRQTGEIRMEAADSYVELRFAEDSPQAPIAYRLGGIQTAWNIVSQHQLQVHRPIAGTYQLQLRKKNIAGQWETSPLTLSLLVVRPLYARTWFILLMSLLLLSLLGLALYRVVQYKRAQQQLESQVQEQRQQIQTQTRQLEELQASKSNMFADIVHEIRSPLSLIMGLNEAIMIERYGSANGNIKGASRIALRNGQKLVKLVEEILELSKLDMIQLELDEKPVNFYPYIHGLYSMLRPKALAKGIQIQFHYQLAQQIFLLLDLNKFEKIFNNLLGNAIKFTPKGGAIQVSLEAVEAGKTICLRVKDTGPGIPEEDLKRIFDRHRQLDNKKLSGSYGVGIGLALAKSYAEMFEGDITVESRPGAGATFAFTFPQKLVPGNPAPLPLPSEAKRVEIQPSSANRPLSASAIAPPVAPPVAEVAIIPSSPPKKAKPRILVVEDNEDMRDFLRQLFAPHYKVRTAVDGQEALELLARHPGKIDLVVSDMIMPRMDGVSLLKNIRSHDKWRALPFLMLTAETRDSQRKDAFTFGVDDYLLKPFSSDELLIRIKALLKNAKQRMKWQQSHSPASSPEEVQTNEVKMTQADLDWLKKLEETTQQEIGNHQFNLLDLASVMAVSERQLFRRIKRLTGMTPNKYFRDIKLQKAKELLENHTYGTISEVSYAIGFEDPHYFSKIYAAHFGKKPSAYFSQKVNS